MNRIFEDFTYYQFSVWHVLCIIKCSAGYGSSHSSIDHQYEPSGTDLYTCYFYSSICDWYGRTSVGTAGSRCFVSDIGCNPVSDCVTENFRLFMKNATGEIVYT